jgi:predicted Zn-dependent protease
MFKSARKPQMLAVALALGLAACSKNPVTGRQELALVSEKQELSMGLQAHKEVSATMGLYEDQKLQDYVQELGLKMAKASERPSLPWTFGIIDDASVNAFALPGGYIYVTRGMMTHLGSEAELAAVLGHEIGHVTARHSVSRISNAQLAQVGLLAGMILKPELQQYGDVAMLGMNLMFLQNSRSHERQADTLGLRYMSGSGYEPEAMAEVFSLLRDVSQQQSQGRLPTWLSTHPDPEDRRKKTHQNIDKLGIVTANARLDRDAYLQRIDGMIFGENPREGFFEGNIFLHPDMRFTMAFPQGWQTMNQKQGVLAISPRKDAAVQVSLSRQASPRDAAMQFLRQQGIRASAPRATDINGLPSVASQFAAQAGQGQSVQGIAVFIAHEGKVFQVLGYGAAGFGGSPHARTFDQSISSFRRLTDATALAVQPKRLEVVRVDGELTLEQFAQRYPSGVPFESLKLINPTADGRLPAGSLAKRVVDSPAAPRALPGHSSEPGTLQAERRPADAADALQRR